MPPRTMSTVTVIRRLVICDHCGKEYQQRNLKEHTKRVNPGCPHRERLAKGNPNPRNPGLMSYLLCLMSYVLCLVRPSLFYRSWERGSWVYWANLDNWNNTKLIYKILYNLVCFQVLSYASTEPLNTLYCPHNPEEGSNK